MSVVREIVPEIFARPDLLADGERQFLDDLHGEVLRGLRERHLPDDPALERDFLGGVQVVREHLLRFVDAGFADEAMREFRQFCEAFPSWGGDPGSTRRDSCDELRRIGNELHQHRFNCNVSRVVSNSVSAVGGGALLGGAILTALTGPVAPLIIAGAAMVAVGATTAVGTSATETIITKLNVDTANGIIEEDRRRSAVLEPWLVRSAQMETAIQGIREVNLAEDVVDAVKGVVRDAVDIYLGHNVRSVAKTCAQAALAVIPHEMGGAANALVLLVDLLVLLVLLRQRNVLVCDLAGLTFRIALGVLALLDGATDLGLNVAALLAGGGAAVGRNVGAAVARGTLAVFSIALDISLIAMSAIDLSRGSRSEYGDRMISLADLMETQRAYVEEGYNDVMRRLNENQRR